MPIGTPSRPPVMQIRKMIQPTLRRTVHGRPSESNSGILGDRLCPVPIGSDVSKPLIECPHSNNNTEWECCPERIVANSEVSPTPAVTHQLTSPNQAPNPDRRRTARIPASFADNFLPSAHNGCRSKESHRPRKPRRGGESDIHSKKSHNHLWINYLQTTPAESNSCSVSHPPKQRKKSTYRQERSKKNRTLALNIGSLSGVFGRPPVSRPKPAPKQQKRRPKAALLKATTKNGLQRRFDLEAPGLQAAPQGYTSNSCSAAPTPARRVDRMYWSGGSLNSFTICSKEVTVGTTGPMGSGLPQFGFPRRFAIDFLSLSEE